MCHLWKKKTMACGHGQVDWRIERCEKYNPKADQAFACGISIHVDEARPYTPGDIDCDECILQLASQEAMQNQWTFAIATAMDQHNHIAVQNARGYLLSLDHIKWRDTFTIHSSLIQQYIKDGSVMDVDAALGEKGYSTPSMPHPSQPIAGVVMTEEEQATVEAEKEDWKVLEISEEDNNDEYDFWEAMDFDNDSNSVLHRIEEEDMDEWYSGE
ncbi:hypothetical protein F4805DRAFT_457125 [Annulohypoxylon moriforme]|nr:hypothetical protein F4805DRAFT_457125 [Annulohypoxylon moriforme]